MKKLILASASPRREQLLHQIGLIFEVHPSEIEEILDPQLKPRQQVERLSLQKAQEVAKRFENAIILAADSMVAIDGEVLGKPQNVADAQQMLSRLSGTVHWIVTGFTLLDTKMKKIVTKSTETKIWFRKMTQEEIARFIEKDKPFDKAGAYGIQELAAVFVKKIEGDYPGAVGLPIFHVAEALKKFGVEIL